MLKILDEKAIKDLVIGGCILGGGGGGSLKEGLKMGELAIQSGLPKIIQLNDINDEDIILTVSAVGAPSAENQFILPIDFVETISLIEKQSGFKTKAIITNENGGLATVNGLFQSAITGIPVLDVACNGRAHPTGVMGSMGLNTDSDYKTIQAAVGGEPGTSYRLKQLIEGDINSTSKLVRQMSVLAGGLVAVARNPVSKEYLKKNGARGAISHAYDVGRAHNLGENPDQKINNVVDVLNGKIVAEGTVSLLEFQTIDGFDVGKVTIEDGDYSYSLTIWNEYITCDKGHNRIGTFPDLIMTFDAETGMPVTSSEIKEDLKIVVIYADKKNLRLGEGMRIKENYKQVEEVVQKDIVSYINDIF
jgi:hypothetical protein